MNISEKNRGAGNPANGIAAPLSIGLNDLTNEGILQSALIYSKLNWPVFPVHDGRSIAFKTPFSKFALNGFKDATLNETKIRDWFSKTPNVGIGIPTGRISSLVVIDFDSSKDLNSSTSILETVARLESEVGKLPDTLTVNTPSGGLHYYFKSNLPIRSRARILPNIDVRADGGYIVAPPTRGPNSTRYSYDVVMGGKIVELPEVLSRFLVAYSDIGKNPFRDLGQVESKVIQGSRNCTLASAAGHLFRQNVNGKLAARLLSAWAKTFSPPMSQREIDSVIGSIAKAELRRRQGGL